MGELGHSDPRLELDRILDKGELTSLYQPIMNLDSGNIVGFEGFVRGPSWSSLVSPLKLIRSGFQYGLGVELVTLIVRTLIQNFRDRRLQGNLFLNCTGELFSVRPFMSCLEKVCDSQSVSVVMTVKDLSNDSREDLGGFVRFTNEARDAGAKLCMDLEILNLCRHGRDLPQPVADYVRINKYFVENLARDAVKQQRLKQELSQLELSAGQLIAEGIESQMDLITAKLLGIGCAQGRYIARPTSLPSHVPSAASLKALNAQDNDPLERRSPQERRLGESTLIREVQPVKPDTLNAEVFVRFESNPNLELVPVVEEGIPKGLISRFDMIDNFARPFRSELYGRKPCQLFMDSDPLVVDINMSIQELTSLASHESPKHLSRGFIITHKGRYLGVATGQDLVREMTAMQVESARHCNPLTQLPGNVYIADSIDELLRSGRAFVVCYFDLDHFKPFNDVYGYSAGDRLIKTVAGVLEKACRRDEDFLGHIGGDDFIAVFVDDDWRERCDVILQQFDQEVRCFFSLDDLEHGGYVTENRIGQKEFQPLTTLSIGALPVSAESFNSHFEVARVAAEAKKKAKKIPGNSLYINQRGHGGDA